MSDHLTPSSHVAGVANEEHSTPSHLQDLKHMTDSCISDTDEDEGALRKMRRKIDLRIIPIAAFIYLFNFLDKVAFNVSEGQEV